MTSAQLYTLAPMKAEFTKHHAPKYNYTGAHVTIEHEDQTLLGIITYICPDEFLCQVKYFNGDLWPINPALSRLEILERTYKDTSDE